MANFAIQDFNISRDGYKTLLTAEISTLQANAGGSVFHTVPCGERGLSVAGQDHTVDFMVVHVDLDNEGDIETYQLSPTKESILKVPGVARTQEDSWIQQSDP